MSTIVRKAAGSGGPVRTVVRIPVGSSTWEASPGWSTSTTTRPWLARSSARVVPSVRESPPPGEYTSTGRRPGSGGAPLCPWVRTAPQSTVPGCGSPGWTWGARPANSRASAGVSCGARGKPCADRAGYRTVSISSRAPPAHGSVRDGSTRWTVRMPTGCGPVGAGSRRTGPLPGVPAAAAAGSRAAALPHRVPFRRVRREVIRASSARGRHDAKVQAPAERPDRSEEL